jgi:hypothetical protein
MKNIIRLEEAAMFAVSIYGLYLLDVEWWAYFIMLFGPDIGMIGYAAGKEAGALTYNLFHNKTIAILVFIAALALDNTLLEITGIILFGHSSMDRMFGYGLKLSRGFKYTHLGMIGKK